jgi:Zn finger protein HypA/HybF involved in hydrogenase expression
MKCPKCGTVQDAVDGGMCSCGYQFGLYPQPNYAKIVNKIIDNFEYNKLERIGELAVKVYNADHLREEARLLRNREMFKHPCKIKTQFIKPCYRNDHFMREHTKPWCKNCLSNQPLHEDYIFKAHVVSNLKGRLNKAIKEYTGVKSPKDNDIIEDGFGSSWSAWCPTCGKKSMSVVRPGKVQCNNC